MKKLTFSLMLILASCVILSSCSEESNDEKDNYEFNKSLIYGSWSQIITENSDYITMTLEIIWSFNSNNVASQQVIMKVNGYTSENIKNSYSYVYNRDNTITFTNEKNKVWTYEVSVNGNHMTLGNKEDGYFELTKK